MAITHVQSAGGTSSSSPIVAAYGVAPTAGNLMVAYCVGFSSSTFTGLNNWNQLTYADAAGNANTAMFWKIAGASESPTQSICTVSAGTNFAMCCSEYTGYSVWAVDVESNTAQANVATILAPGSALTPVSSVERLIYAGARAGASITYSAYQVNSSATGVTNRASQLAGFNVTVWDKIVASTSGTYQGSVVPSATSTGELGGLVIFSGTVPTLSGGPTLTPVSVAGTVAETYVLSGGPTLARVSVAGTVAETYVLNGGPTLAGVQVSGTLTSGAATTTLSGGPTLARVSISGALAETYVLNGGPTLAGVQVSGNLSVPVTTPPPIAGLAVYLFNPGAGSAASRDPVSPRGSAVTTPPRVLVGSARPT